MSSAAQIAANRVNSQLSTGPRTPEGKARSSQNARKEGFNSATLHILPEQKDEFERFRQAVHRDTRPDGAIESEYVHRLIASGWNLRRVRYLESELLADSDFVGDELDAAKLQRLARYRRDLERTYDRALAELRRLQTQRNVLIQQPDAVVGTILDRTPMAELSAITKLTDPVLRKANHPLFHPADAFSEIRRGRRNQPQAVSRNEVNPEPATHPLAAEIAFSRSLDDTEKRVLASFAKEAA
jgi:hypothetical protein